MRTFLKRLTAFIPCLFLFICGGCFAPFACFGIASDCAMNTANCIAYSKDGFTDDLSNYGTQLWEDKDRGINFLYVENEWQNCFWGSVSAGGSPVRAYFNIYYDGDTFIYIPKDPTSAFSEYEEAAHVCFEMSGGYVAITKVYSNPKNLTLDGALLSPSTAPEALPREGGLASRLADREGIVSCYYGTGDYYFATVRYKEGGYISAKDCYMFFGADKTVALYGYADRQFVAGGKYYVIDYNTVQITLDSGILAGVFKDYPQLVLSSRYYASL